MGNYAFDLFITIGGGIYGLILLTGYFFRNPVGEHLRIDKLITPKPSESTRMLNLALGLLFFSYSVYTIYEHYIR